MSLATNEVYKDRDGQRQQRVDWHRIVAWNGLAENCLRNLSKGDHISLIGSLRINEWTDQRSERKRRTVEVHASSIDFIEVTAFRESFGEDASAD